MTIDFDSLIVPLEQRQKEVDLFWLSEALLNEARKSGSVRQACAYACWNKKRYGNQAEILKQKGIEPAIIRGQAKNQADIEIIQHISKQVYFFDIFIVVTNDDDLLPAFKAVKKAGKEIYLYYWPETVNSRLLDYFSPQYALSLENILNLGPFNEPNGKHIFTNEDLQIALVTALILSHKSEKQWLHYQHLIESLLPDYSYKEASDLICSCIDRDIFILDHYYDGVKKNIIFVNNDSPEVVSTIELLNNIMFWIYEKNSSKAIENLADLNSCIQNNPIVQQTDRNPNVLSRMLLKLDILRQYCKRIPGSFSTINRIQLNYNSLFVKQSLQSMKLAA